MSKKDAPEAGAGRKTRESDGEENQGNFRDKPQKDIGGLRVGLYHGIPGGGERSGKEVSFADRFFVPHSGTISAPAGRARKIGGDLSVVRRCVAGCGRAADVCQYRLRPRRRDHGSTGGFFGMGAVSWRVPAGLCSGPAAGARHAGQLGFVSDHAGRQ